MKGKGAEVTATKAATIVGNGKLHLGNSWHSAFLFINRVVISYIWKCINLVKLLSFKRECRWVLHQLFVVVVFNNCLAIYSILISILNAKGSGVFLFVFFNYIVIKFSTDGEMHLIIYFA